MTGTDSNNAATDTVVWMLATVQIVIMGFVTIGWLIYDTAQPMNLRHIRFLCQMCSMRPFESWRGIYLFNKVPKKIFAHVHSHTGFLTPYAGWESMGFRSLDLL